MRTMTDEFKQKALVVLDYVEDYRATHGKNPQVRDFYKQLIWEYRTTNPVIQGVVRDLRKKFGFMEDRHQELGGLSITLSGYRFMEQEREREQKRGIVYGSVFKNSKQRRTKRNRAVKRIQNSYNTVDSKRVAVKPSATVSMGESKPVDTHSKDVLIGFMKWIYTLDDEEICGDGWKTKIVEKLETLLA